MESKFTLTPKFKINNIMPLIRSSMCKARMGLRIRLPDIVQL